MSPVSPLLSDKAKGRFDAFSDGVFAIVITLLVLELHVPTGRQHLASTLGEEWPRYLGYFVSFAFIGGVWVAHSTVSHFIKAVDATLMRLNLVLLLFVSLLPFTTGILATHLFASVLPIDRVTEPLPGFGPERLAVVVFGVNLTLAALMTFLVIRHVDKTDELAVRGAARRSSTAPRCLFRARHQRERWSPKTAGRCSAKFSLPSNLRLSREPRLAAAATHRVAGRLWVTPRSRCALGATRIG